MAGKNAALAFRVFVPDEDGELHDFAAGTTKSDMPKWAVKAIENPKAWGDHDDTDEDVDDTDDLDSGDDLDGDDDGDDDGDGDGDDDGDGDTQPYSKWLKADLEDEIAKRNEARDDDDLIEPEEPGNKPELIAALEADDAAGA